jgi:hypothetical protein
MDKENENENLNALIKTNRYNEFFKRGVKNE